MNLSFYVYTFIQVPTFYKIKMKIIFSDRKQEAFM